MFEPDNLMETDLLILSVLQPYRVMNHAQRRDDEVNQSEDAVQPQEAVPVRQEHTTVLSIHKDEPVFSLSRVCGVSWDF